MILAGVFGWPPPEYDRLTPDELKTWVEYAEAIAKARKAARGG